MNGVDAMIWPGLQSEIRRGCRVRKYPVIEVRSCSSNREVFIMAANTFQPVPLEQETRSALPTHEAAFHLSRAQQTLRLWAMREDGPLRPMRINGRLAWKVSDIKSLVGVGK
jgi:hypothetical protein